MNKLYEVLYLSICLQIKNIPQIFYSLTLKLLIYFSVILPSDVNPEDFHCKIQDTSAMVQ